MAALTRRIAANADKYHLSWWGSYQPNGGILSRFHVAGVRRRGSAICSHRGRPSVRQSGSPLRIPRTSTTDLLISSVFQPAIGDQRTGGTPEHVAGVAVRRS